MCIRQEESAPVMYSAPVDMWSRTLSADLVGAHACGYGRLLYGEHASEAAALIDPGRLHDLDAIHEGKQVPELGIMGDVQL